MNCHCYGGCQHPRCWLAGGACRELQCTDEMMSKGGLLLFGIVRGPNSGSDGNAMTIRHLCLVVCLAQELQCVWQWLFGNGWGKLSYGNPG